MKKVSLIVSCILCLFLEKARAFDQQPRCELPTFTQHAKLVRFPRQCWTEKEDEMLTAYVELYGENKWSEIAKTFPSRDAGQCRQRWLLCLKPGIDHSIWKEEEDNLIMSKFTELGRKWKIIATFLPGRTNLQVHNRYNQHIRKKMENKLKNKNIKDDFLIENLLNKDNT